MTTNETMTNYNQKKKRKGKKRITMTTNETMTNYNQKKKRKGKERRE
jgi:hypothetical protein